SSDPMITTNINRREILGGAVAIGAVGLSGSAGAQRAQQSDRPLAQADQGNNPMSYIGTPASRVDGRAKVTGTAKYAAEFNQPDLAYAAVVESTIPKGRITRIDTSNALRVSGVIDVLTHENRPFMAEAPEAWRDDV